MIHIKLAYIIGIYPHKTVFGECDTPITCIIP